MTSIWTFASTMSIVTALASVVAFQHAADRSFVAMILWLVIAAALIAPLVLVRGLLRTSAYDEATMRTMARRIILVGYVPLQAALLLLAFGR